MGVLQLKAVLQLPPGTLPRRFWHALLCGKFLAAVTIPKGPCCCCCRRQLRVPQHAAALRAVLPAGHPSGLFGLGYLYLSGRGLSQSYPRALKYFKQAVESPAGAWAGQGDAFFYLGGFGGEEGGRPAHYNESMSKAPGRARAMPSSTWVGWC